MQKFGAAQTAGRVEDVRFLTGQGRYVDDLAPMGALHAAFLRAPVAHGRITGLDFSDARAIPGVHLVMDAEGLEAAGVNLAMRAVVATNRDGTKGADPLRPVLAKGVMRFVGEPVAIVVADTAEAARDAIEAIVLDYEELPHNLAMDADGATIHPEAPGNRAFDYAMGDGAAVEAALSASAHRVVLEVVHNRVAVVSMEPRACMADWRDGRMHFAFGGQGVWNQKGELARMLGLPLEAVQVTNPDVGGGFGMKGMPHPEYIPVAAAARILGRPVRWASDRSEAMLSDNAARDLVAVTELGFDEGHRLTAYRARVRSNLGAYNSLFAQNIQSFLFSKVLTGPYDIPVAVLETEGFFTNTTPVDAYRGAGRPEAILTIERAMDHAARVLGVDPFDLRERNMIKAFPYKMVNGETIQDGDFPRVLKRLSAEADVAGYPARKAESAGRGLLRGMGLAFYIEAILGDPNETAKVEFRADGTVAVYVGTQSNGQGHETVYTRLLAERTGIPEGRIVIVQGDSDAIAKGGGTGGSRSVTMQGSAIHATAGAMVATFAAWLVDDLGEGVTFADGTFGAPGTNRRLTMIEAAELARDRGQASLLVHQETWQLQNRSFPNGGHVAEVEVDPETGQVSLVRYTVTDDFGNLISPQLVEGQVHGGVAQGFGQAVTENTAYDDQGQLLTGSFMDYAMPRATDLPFMTFTTEPVPTATNPLGMKGCGEAGTVGSLGAISNAVADALASVGVGHVDMPFTPVRVWQWIEEARAGHS